MAVKRKYLQVQDCKGDEINLFALKSARSAQEIEKLEYNELSWEAKEKEIKVFITRNAKLRQLFILLQ